MVFTWLFVCQVDHGTGNFYKQLCICLAENDLWDVLWDTKMNFYSGFNILRVPKKVSRELFLWVWLSRIFWSMTLHKASTLWLGSSRRRSLQMIAGTTRFHKQQSPILVSTTGSPTLPLSSGCVLGAFTCKSTEASGKVYPLWNNECDFTWFIKFLGYLRCLFCWNSQDVQSICENECLR